MAIARVNVTKCLFDRIMVLLLLDSSEIRLFAIASLQSCKRHRTLETDIGRRFFAENIENDRKPRDLTGKNPSTGCRSVAAGRELNGVCGRLTAGKRRRSVRRVVVDSVDQNGPYQRRSVLCCWQNLCVEVFEEGCERHR